METLYRKVAVSERLPEKYGKYYIIDITGELNKVPFRENEFHSWQPTKYWLEEIPDPTAKLQADKTELLSILKGLVSDVGNLIGEHYIEWQQAGYFECAKEVIQKHKPREIK